MSETAARAIQRFVEALNTQAKNGTARAAFAPTANVYRYAADNHAVAAALFTNHDLHESWIRRTPETSQFTLLDGGLEDLGEGWWKARYEIRAPGDFVNHGTWRFKLADDERIAELHHQPDPLKDP